MSSKTFFLEPKAGEKVDQSLRTVYFTQPFLTNKIRLDQMQGDINAIAFKV
jgi:hypothetical protein